LSMDRMRKGVHFSRGPSRCSRQSGEAISPAGVILFLPNFCSQNWRIVRKFLQKTRGSCNIIHSQQRECHLASSRKKEAATTRRSQVAAQCRYKDRLTVTPNINKAKFVAITLRIRSFRSQYRVSVSCVALA
jgi:hypothetical protein